MTNDEWKNFEPRKNAPFVTQNAKPAVALVDINNPGALKALAMEALVEIVQTARRNVSLVGAIRELIDRIEGKAPQSIALDVQDKRMDKMPIDQLLRLAALLDEPILINPMPKKDENSY